MVWRQWDLAINRPVTRFLHTRVPPSSRARKTPHSITTPRFPSFQSNSKQGKPKQAISRTITVASTLQSIATMAPSKVSLFLALATLIAPSTQQINYQPDPNDHEVCHDESMNLGTCLGEQVSLNWFDR